MRVVLALVPARPHSDVDAAAGDVVDRHGHASEHARMPEGRRRDERAEADSLRDRREPGERRPGIERVGVGSDDRRVVVGAEEALEPVLFGEAGQAHPVVPGDALLPLDHQTDAHRSLRPHRRELAYCGDESIPRHEHEMFDASLRDEHAIEWIACATRVSAAAARPCAHVTGSSSKPARVAPASNVMDMEICPSACLTAHSQTLAADRNERVAGVLDGNTCLRPLEAPGSSKNQIATCVSRRSLTPRRTASRTPASGRRSPGRSRPGPSEATLALLRLGRRNELCHRSAVAGKHDLLSRLDETDELGEARLRLVHVDHDHAS